MTGTSADDSSTGSGPVGATDATGGQIYVVQAGDCLDSIGFANGFTWQTLWGLPQNAELKRVRKTPFILMAGDRVYIPNLRVQQRAGAAGARHTFRRKGVPSKFKMRLLSGGKPRANLAYRLLIDDETTLDGSTDGDGWIRVAIPPKAQSATLTVGAGLDKQVMNLQLGGVDPITELSGVQGRLSNLGFTCGEPGTLDDATRLAITQFQQKAALPETGQPDDQTRQAIVDAFGS
jgi:hypothetical protein